MKNIKTQLFSLLFVSIAFVSCSDSDSSDLDTQKPTISIQSPTDHQEVEPGSELNIQALFQDETALASYKVEIHAAGDGHEHRTIALDNKVPFTYENVFQIESNPKSYQVDYSISIPENAKEDHYHVGIFCIDAAGNQSQQFVEIFIGHEHNH
ncbi:DUF4625 domain-containing protein [Paenimyroides tangerinum]|uniref:DUF4625 domain-containing protein n=1 Tax=Paenimyroides tangerinum TaxID=2488728 RepID=A0A3P3VYD3_9FLAO|nr:DUF4625 domain-containing protein [Paenimyroides tangerinum]RRJ87710.1 DUF4625 domain-containing protein [Paenimyroides tangerinum]